jgi:hypothetical protein
MVLEGTCIGSLIVALVTKEFATLNVNTLFKSTTTGNVFRELD